MKKSLRKFFADGGGAKCFSLSYSGGGMGTEWTIYVGGVDRLCISYTRGGQIEGIPDENLLLILAPADAAAIGAALTAWAASRGEKA